MEKVGVKAKILVVEDESIVALDMRSRLISMGYDVAGIASSGEEALALVAQTRPDLILMDIKLQGDLDGVDTAELVHKSQDTPVIFVTAFADERTLSRAKVTHAFGYILKPFQEREVLISIEMALYKHRLEHDLRVSREWLHGTIHAISDGIIALDADERIVFVNHAAEVLLGVEDKDAKGSRIEDHCEFIPSKMLSGLLPFPRSGDGADPFCWDRQWVMLSASRGKIPVELIRTRIQAANAESTGFVLSIRDISDIFSAEAVKTRLATIVSNSYDSILSIDPSLSIVSWNLGAERIYGYSAAEMVGKSVQTIAADDAERRGFQAIVELVLSGQDVGRFETIRRTLSGKTITVSMSLSPLRDPEGKVNEIACIERDVSAEKEYEESLILAKRAAEEVSRVKSEFLSNMSHELRTPLNSIMGMIDLSRDLSVSDEQREYMDIARQSAENLLFLINSILDFSKIEAGKMRIQLVRFDPLEAVEDCLEELSVQAHRKGLFLRFRPTAGMPRSVEGDPRRFKQIVTNLLSNAVKFTESGGVRVSLSSTREDGNSSALFTLQVQDTGIGIDADRQSSIWETFTQLDGSSTRAYGGTGLGLSIVKSLTDLMGGSVGLESDAGKGCTFSVAVPFLVIDDASSVEAPLDGALSVSLALSDGEERAMLSELLSEWGCGVRVLNDADEILDDLRAGEHALIVDDLLQYRDILFKRMQRNGDGPFPGIRLIVLSEIGAKNDPGWKAVSASSRVLYKPVRRSVLKESLAAVDEISPATADTVVSSEALYVNEEIGREQSVSRDHLIRAELASGGIAVQSLERFLQEAQAVGESPSALLENAAARCRRDLESARLTILPQYLFKIVLACRRDDENAVAQELRRIREAIELGTHNGVVD